MRQILVLSVLTMVFTGTAHGQSYIDSIMSGGTMRTFIVHAPSGLPDNPPLVLSMHGLGGSGSQQRSMSGFDKIADREKFIVVFPDGIYQFGGSNGWDVSGKTDTDFLAALIDTMIARKNVDPERVYAGGFSMGGMVSYCLAGDHGDKLAAIGPCSGYNPRSPSNPVSIIHIHGTDDTAVPYENLAAIIDKWVNFNDCPQTAQVTDPYPASNSNSKTKKEHWGPCDKEETDIVVLTVEGMDHAWPSSMMGTQDIVASEEYWEFFKAHPGPTGISLNNSSSMKRFVSVNCSAGKINLQGLRGIYSVQMVDLQGKTILIWKAHNGSVNTVAFPANRFARGMYLMNVTDAAAGTATLRVVVP